MLITFVDDSFAFDGTTPQTHPLGGAEKAFASLPGALATAGHPTMVYNQTPQSMLIEEAVWDPFNRSQPAPSEILVAFRKPALLAFTEAERRFLWWTAPTHLLNGPTTREILKSAQARIVFLSRSHLGDWQAPPDVRALVIPPGLRPEYLAQDSRGPATPPVAIVTTHPLHGLDLILSLWTERIHPACPEAELHVYSASLYAAAQGGPLPEALTGIYAQVSAAAAQGVKVLLPLADGGMATAYGSARVHLYPGHEEDHGCYTLAESQASGCPAVAFDRGATRERIWDGESGHIVPDAEAFGNLAALLLSNDDIYWSLSGGARLHQRGRSWAEVGQDWLKVMAPSGEASAKVSP